ncbi:hypothetical protein FRC0263_00231 [Corynebacterium diphtheriae]|nr:hypothetical protein CDIPH_00560 [Corynebacterium diphtheriae]CAB0577855.1 hypothetical protein CIP107555_00027 [Corynebacterium diphtheriae]CAB0583091.1 hypothetical protein CIP107542_00213 [Corynebacterium diphtheriae]CAB0785875.1 hypothetical protein FRC0263_00231 [Corynebacterium diphtheriae]CAB0875523.1 hypothetical protein FRC0405_00083 [Corynebacterium diphtheriae]
MGRRDEQKAEQRWKTDPNGDYAQGRRSALQAANAKRDARRAALFKGENGHLGGQNPGGADPSSKELADTLGTSVRRIRHTGSGYVVVRVLWPSLWGGSSAA